MRHRTHNLRSRQEQIEVWQPSEMPALELRRGTAVRAPYPRHWHEEYQLCLILGGGGELAYRGNQHATPVGSLFIVHPGEVHANEPGEFFGCSFRSLYLNPELMLRAGQEAAGHKCGLPFFPQTIIFDQELVSLFYTLHCALEVPSLRLTQDVKLLDLLTQLISRYAEIPLELRTTGKERQAVRRVREYLTDHCADNVSLEQMARLAGLSPYHLNRVFREETGLPPHAFQIQARIIRAKTMLRQGESIARVAMLTGFADQSHFTRHFKRLLMIPPGQYQNRKNVQDYDFTAR